ncbi:MAG: undecaprenyl-diphosphatase UppP [Patescibacteria group bacterium]
MDILYSTIAGIIQGLTEFLPVSSSGHLVFFHYFFGFDFINDLSFDAVLHLGTLAALGLFFFSDIFKYLAAFFQSFIRWNIKSDVNQRLAWYLFLATIPALLVGYFFESQIETVFRSPALVAWVFIIFGVILYLADKYLLTNRSMNQLTLSNSLIIGLAQALALIPGVSRSGITIVAGLTQNLKREQAARFSFLLAIPAVFAAGAKKMLDLYQLQAFSYSNSLILLVGFLASAVVGYLCIKYFLKFLENHSLKVFAYYRIVVGVIVLVVLFFS